MSTTPPGWYDDGQHPGQRRYWDGTQWTEQYQPAPGAAAPAAAPTQQYAPAAAAAPKKPSVWVWLAPVLIVLVAGATVLGLWLGGVFGKSPLGGGGTVTPAPTESTVTSIPTVPVSPTPTEESTDPPTDDAAAAEFTVQAFNDYWSAGDCENVKLYTTQHYQDSLTNSGATDFCDIVTGFEAVDIEFTGTTVDGDTATVLTHETGQDSGQEYDWQYDLVLEDGYWYIDAIFEP